ncbi:hypothetical protein T484DRAFT_1820719 [Baffinella frigidus]|nr:hypothetical protein T484DRAFT_1820719 [Cryptophyta sp. CCMP2293]
MSRASGVKAAIHASADVRAIKPSGDCLFDCFAEAFSIHKIELLKEEGVVAEAGDDASTALRRTAAAALDAGAMEQFQMCHAAGLSDFNFMRKCHTLDDLRAAMLVSGREKGAGKCIWAGEFEIASICTALGASCLILDLEARNLSSRHVAIHPKGSLNLSF